jgi:hypothetical protein
MLIILPALFKQRLLKTALGKTAFAEAFCLNTRVNHTARKKRSRGRYSGKGN